MDLDKLRDYIVARSRAAGLNQAELASRLGMEKTTLSHKLRASPGRYPHGLNLPELKKLLLILTQENAFIHQTEVLDLIELAGFQRTIFNPAEWNSPPFNKLTPLAPAQIDSVLCQRNNLKALNKKLVGREGEKEALRTLLFDKTVQLVTVTGIGGGGKTHLALEVAQDVLGSFRDGVFMLELVASREPELVVAEIVRMLGVKPVPNQPLIEILKRYLRHRQLLLILDNFEHVLGVAPLLGELLQSAPLLKILVTSREKLHLRQEHAVIIKPLPLPVFDATTPGATLLANPAIALFLAHVQLLGVTIEANGQNLRQVARICWLVDGLPLAIELAAGWVKTLGLAEIIESMETHFGFLASDLQDIAPRHQTIEQMLDWSYHLLPQEEQVLFCQLGVFSGKFDLPAVSQICLIAEEEQTTLLLNLRRLIDKSLVMAASDNGTVYYSLLYQVRNYAYSKLSEVNQASALLDRFFEYYVALVEKAAGHYRTALESEWLNILEHAHTQFQGFLSDTLNQSEKSDAFDELAIRLTTNLWWYWYRRGHWIEGSMWLGKIMLLPEYDAIPGIRALVHLGLALMQPKEMPLEDSAVLLARSNADYAKDNQKHRQALTLFLLGKNQLERGHIEGAKKWLAQSGELYDAYNHVWCRGLSSGIKAVLATLEQQAELSNKLSTESMVYLKQAGDAWAAVQLGSMLARIELDADGYNTTRQILEWALAGEEKNRDYDSIINCSYWLGVILQRQGKYTEALKYYQHARELMGHHPTSLNETAILIKLCCTLAWVGDKVAAEACFVKILALSQQNHNNSAVLLALCDLSYSISTAGASSLVKAVEVLAAAVRVFDDAAPGITNLDKIRVNNHAAHLNKLMGEHEFEAAWQLGKQMNVEQAFHYALACISDKTLTVNTSKQ